MPKMQIQPDIAGQPAPSALPASVTAATTLEQARQIAARFVAARAAGLALEGFPGTIPQALDDAYRVQDMAIARVAESIGGWKVGRILPPLSERYGADRLAGPILKRVIQFAHAGGASVGRVFTGGFGAAEAEFLLRIGIPPPAGQTKFSLAEAAAMIDRVHVGIEIASSPLATINELGPPVVISDFGNNNGLIVGAEIADWRGSGFADWSVRTLVDGVEAGCGQASSFPDGPIGSVRFLLELLARRGIELPPGTWVSSGAISGVHDVKAGQRVEARFGPVMNVSCMIERVAQN
jgi:2-keto-4-pentenoate hydratase